MSNLYWDWKGKAPEVSLTGVPDAAKGEKLLAEFRARCQELYVSFSVANIGLAEQRTQFIAKLPRGTYGTIGFVSREADFASPPLSHSVPQMSIDQYIKAMEPDGEFVQYQNKTLLVFIYQTWEDYIRPQIAKLYSVDVTQVRCDLMGEIRHVRNDIIHRQGRIPLKRELPMLRQILNVERGEWEFAGEDMRHILDQICSLQVFIVEDGQER